jgi:hypothetical protein
MISNSPVLNSPQPEPQTIDGADAMFTLCVNAKWLVGERYREGLKALIAECSDHRDVDVIQHILQSLRYCTSADIDVAAGIAADVIQNQWKLSPADTLLVGVAEPNKTCGSQLYVRALEVQLPIAWGNCIYPNFVSAFKFRNGKANLVIVDDFIGTGKKVGDRIERLRNNPKTSSFNIYVVAFAGMDEGLTKIANDVNNNIEAYIILEKCLSTLQPKTKADEFRNLMQTLEANFFDKPGAFSSGFGNSEASFYLEGANIPNNTFPILWWEKYKDDSKRSTLFRRR